MVLRLPEFYNQLNVFLSPIPLTLCTGKINVLKVQTQDEIKLGGMIIVALKLEIRRGAGRGKLDCLNVPSMQKDLEVQLKIGVNLGILHPITQTCYVCPIRHLCVHLRCLIIYFFKNVFSKLKILSII